MTIKRKLFLWNQHKVRSNLKSGASSEDKFAQVFGSIIPRQIPESSAWWKVFVFRLLVFLMCLIARRAYQAQSRDLEAICDDAEQGERPCASSSMLRAPHVRVL